MKLPEMAVIKNFHWRGGSLQGKTTLRTDRTCGKRTASCRSNRYQGNNGFWSSESSTYGKAATSF